MAIERAKPRTDPEDPLAIPAAPILEWYRVDVSRRLVSRLAVGSVAMVIGLFGVTRLVMGSGVSSLAWGLAGIAVVVSGGVYAVIGLQRILGEEQYVALRVDGVLIVDGDARRYVRWSELDEVRHDAARDAVVIVTSDGDEWTLDERFAGIASEDLARSIAATRRKALFGILSSR